MIILSLAACGGGGGGSGGQAPRDFSGTVFYQIEAGDLNQDDVVDIAAIAVVHDGNPSTTDPPSLHVILQDPARPGHYSVRQRVPLGTPLGVLSLADFNIDGRIDIAVTEPGSGQVRVILQDPDRPGNFGTGNVFAAGSNISSVEAADVDLDGGTDLVVTTRRGLLVLRQDSSAPGTFPASLRLTIDDSLDDDKALPLEQDGLAVADLDADTLVDLATVRWDFDGVRIYPNEPAMPGTFRVAERFSMSLDAPGTLTASDLNLDGYDDLIAAGVDDFEVVVHVSLRNTTSPQTFLAHRGFKLDDKGEPVRIVIADVTADGLPDVLAAKRYVQGSGYIEILRQTTPSFNLVRLAIFPSLHLQGVDPYLRGFAVADLNDDGLLDFAVADGELSVQFNDPGAPGQFLPARRLLD